MTETVTVSAPLEYDPYDYDTFLRPVPDVRATT